MTATALPHPVVLAPFYGGFTGTGVGSANNFQFNAAGDKLAILFIAQSSTVPDLISFVVSTVTTAGSAGNIEATLENVTTGDPSGAVTNSATGSATISTADNHTISGMAGTATITAGTVYAVVLTAGAGWNRDLEIRLATGINVLVAFPTVKTKESAGSWTRDANNNSGWCFGLADSGGTYMQVAGLLGAYTCSTQSFGSGTNPDERGNRFSLNVPMTCIGARVLWSGGSAPGANDDVKIKLLSSHTSSPVAEKSVTLEGEVYAGELHHDIMFGSGFSCAAGTTYAITMEAMGTDTQAMVRWDWPSNTHLAGVVGTSFYATTRNDLGNCTDDNNSIYGIFPIFSHADDGAGGGGGATASGVVGIQAIGTGVIA
jgi:hypothetical protein